MTDIERLKEQMDRLGLSQAELSRFLNVHKNTVNNWMKEKARIPAHVIQFLQKVVKI